MPNAPSEPPALDIHDSIAYRVLRLTRLLRKHFLQLGAAHGIDLTPEQWFCLNKLRIHGQLHQTALTDDIFADRPNITRILNRLERRNLTERLRDPDDGRRYLVQLTPDGVALHDRFAALAQDTRAQLFADIPADQMESAKDVLALLERSVLDAL